MALVKGTNCGFVAVAPVADPGSTGTICDSKVAAQKDVAPVGAILVTEIGWWCDSATEEANYEVGIYSHDAGNDKPNVLLAGADRTNAKGLAAGWKVVTGLNIIIAAGITYWIAEQLDNTATTTRGVFQAATGEKYNIKYGLTLPDPFGFKAERNNNLFGVYALWSTAGPPPAAPKFGSLSSKQHWLKQNKGMFAEI